MELQQGIRRDSTATPSSRESVPFDEVRKRVLIVEDDDAVASLYRRVLTRPDYQLYRACDGDEAVSLVENTPFDAIVSDLAMPGMNGVALLKFVRNHDRDVPIVIVTGKPELDSAITAVECGALRYLLKPVCIQELRDTVAQAVGLRSATGSPRGTFATAADEVPSAPTRESISADFGQALDSLYMVYQPIVQLRRGLVVGYEALVRTRHQPLSRPRDLLAAAEELDAIQELGRKARRAVADTIDGLAGSSLVFVNLHEKELLDETLYSSANPLREHAARVVFELTEQVGVDDMDSCLRTLRHGGFLLAIDDLGAGYRALNQLATFDPDFAKIDTSLVRNIDREPSKRMLVSSLVSVCGKLDVQLVCEGVDTDREATCLLGIGAETQQGHYFSKPRASFTLEAQEPLVRKMEQLRKSYRKRNASE